VGAVGATSYCGQETTGTWNEKPSNNKLRPNNYSYNKKNNIKQREQETAAQPGSIVGKRAIRNSKATANTVRMEPPEDAAVLAAAGVQGGCWKARWARRRCKWCWEKSRPEPAGREARRWCPEKPVCREARVVPESPVLCGAAAQVALPESPVVRGDARKPR
jgi:hypothetical protein